MNKLRILTFSITVLFFCSCATQRVDILVVGGGAGGTTAGIQSARLGAKTLIVEELDWLGGMLTSAGVSAIDGNNKLPGGLWGEFRDSLALRYGGVDKLKTGWVSNTLFEPSVGAQVLTNMCRKENDLNVWMQTKFISAEKVSTGWIVKLRQGNHISKIKTKILIDATELGDVAKACGVKYDVGMDSRAESDESIAPESANNIVQDLTYVMILKDYGTHADKTIEKPKNYDPSHFYCACKTEKCTNPKEEHPLWDCKKMLNYGKLPNNKYMINWPFEGNDYYVNVIEMSDEERTQALQKAKDFSLSFLYYIQHDLGYKNLGLADDEYPTFDKLPFIPYYRESRRIHGLVRFNSNHVTKPYDQSEKLYRTGIAVGDYPIDHHHARYPQWDELPDLHFFPVPSYSLPLGTIIPKDVENLIVAEKSISVSNIINGTTRLQPVVLQVGQASGALAALAVSEKKKVSEVPVRDVQNVILNANGYLMPYLDLPLSDKHFKALQRIGSTGILRGVGKSVDWSNQTWFNADSLVLINELKTGLYEFCGMNIGYSNDILSIEQTVALINDLAIQFNLHKYTADQFKVKWSELGLNDFSEKRKITRKEFAAMLDALIDPFNLKPVNIRGEFTVKKFVLYDAMSYLGKPDLASDGFSRIKVLYEAHLTKPDPNDSTKVILDMNKINKLAAEAEYSNSTVICTDIEQWFRDRSVSGEEMATRFTTMFKVFRDKIDNVEISNYGIAPSALCISRFYNNGKTDEKTLINNWKASNEKRWASANTVDFFAPTVYIAEPNIDSWINDLKITVKEIKAHDATKKIIVFLWPQYYDKKGSPYYKKVIAPEIWQQMLEAVYENCDGAIIWSGTIDAINWDDPRVQAMMNVTKQFIDFHKENKAVFIK